MAMTSHGLVGWFFLFLCLFNLCPGVWAYTQLSDASLRNIPSGQSDFDVDHGALLSPILIPRVPGTPGSAKVQAHFVDFFTKELPKWTVERHNSTSQTPATGDQEVPFTSLIFRRDPPWATPGDVSRLTLAAHYDTLYRPEGFIGAIDSAAPCAMLMHVARSVDEALTKKWDAMRGSGEAGSGLEEEKGVQILFLDGEEAFVQWTATDSLYGARALAEAWEATAHPPGAAFATPLEAISLFVLLDLLGAPNPRIPSFFPATHWAYEHVAEVERRMRDLGLLETQVRHPFLPERNKRATQFASGYIEDDHIPFLQRGVNILHIIPNPFPKVWHTMDDTAANLDVPTIRDWAKIMAAFVAEWMDLEGSVPKLREESDNSDKDEL